MKKYKNRIIIGVLIVIALTAAFFVGGDGLPQKKQSTAPNVKSAQSDNANTFDDTEESPVNSVEKADSAKENDGETADNKKAFGDSEINDASDEEKNKTDVYENHNTETPEQKQQDIEYSNRHGMNIDSKTGTDEYKTEPVPEGKPVPTEPQSSEITDKEMKCILSVRCDTILNNLSKFNSDKMSILPQDGVIFAEKEVLFYEGESVFNVTLREMKKNKIHMEFVNTPIYNSAYIEGIGNIYEYDCGELSGWLYSVNGWFPNYGCSRYTLKNGDKIEWQYTCDLGADVGGYSASSGGQRDE